MKLLLFDIDGVIVKLSKGQASKAHRNSFIEAVKKIYGIDHVLKVDHSGMTDKRIIIEELKLAGLDEKEIKSKLKECMNEMVNVFKNYDNPDLIPVDGIKNLLEKLNQNKDVLIGLLTGNVEGIAYEKMRILGLRDYFKVGGFGSNEHEKRSDLVFVAKEKAEKSGYTIDEIYVIGDTLKDIQAGKEANVKTIAVATGRYSVDELSKYNPDYLFENFKDSNKIIKAILK